MSLCVACKFLPFPCPSEWALRGGEGSGFLTFIRSLSEKVVRIVIGTHRPYVKLRNAVLDLDCVRTVASSALWYRPT